MLQLVNAGGSHADPLSATDDYIPPVLDAVLSVRSEKCPERIVLQPEGRELEFEYSEGRAYVRVNRVDIHSVLQID